jgi:hypothetical protein
VMLNFAAATGRSRLDLYGLDYGEMASMARVSRWMTLRIKQLADNSGRISGLWTTERWLQGCGSLDG